MVMVHEFEILTTLVIPSNKEGEDDILKPNKKYKATFYLHDIKTVEQAFNTNGNVRVHHCLIYHEYKGDLVVKGTYNDIKKIVFENKYKLGYAANK